MNTVDAIVQKALEDSRVNDLYQEILAIHPVRFAYEDREAWGSTTTNGSTEITVSPTQWPNAALAHELLHARLKTKGYRQYLTAVSLNDQDAILMHVIKALDNELQHHRMFADFVQLGLDPKHFYHDDDLDAFDSVRSELKAMGPQDHRGFYLLKYLTLIAPGGLCNDDDRRSVKSFLRTQAGMKTWNAMKEIEGLFQSWCTVPTLDAGPTIQRILLLLGFDRTWIGVSPNDFPADGHFVDITFTEEDALTWRKEPDQV